MPAPQPTKHSISYHAIAKDEDRSKMKETKDCTVIALAQLCGLTYLQAHKAMAKHGRKPKRGASNLTNAINDQSYRLKHIDPAVFIAKYPGRHSTLKHITTHHMSRFAEVWDDGNDYLLRCRNHVAVIIAGSNHDWSQTRKMHIQQIFKVTKANKPAKRVTHTIPSCQQSEPVYKLFEFDFFKAHILSEQKAVYSNKDQAIKRAKELASGWCEDEQPTACSIVDDHIEVRGNCDYGIIIKVVS